MCVGSAQSPVPLFDDHLHLFSVEKINDDFEWEACLTHKLYSIIKITGTRSGNDTGQNLAGESDAWASEAQSIA